MITPNLFDFSFEIVSDIFGNFRMVKMMISLLRHRLAWPMVTEVAPDSFLPA
jgi:hypothetical protein